MQKIEYTALALAVLRIGGKLPSADSTGRIVSLLNHHDVRALNHSLYERLKRNKGLTPPRHGLIALCLDGHESHSSYRRKCSGCLQRTIKTAAGERAQYYHRHVTAQLIADGMKLLLDSESQRPGEDEVATALRLLARIFESYPRAFDVVIADAMYADPRFFRFVQSLGKHVLTVLKDENRDLVRDARRLFKLQKPLLLHRGKRQCECWDMENFTSWPQVTGDATSAAQIRADSADLSMRNCQDTQNGINLAPRPALHDLLRNR